VLDGSTAFYLEQRRSPVMRLGNLKIHIASRIPVVGSAMGRACFAGLTTAARRAAWDALAAGMPPQRRDAARAALDAAAEEVVRQGFCTAFGSWQPDVNAVGAPLVSRDGSRVYGVTCAGPTSVLPQQRLIQEIGPRLADLVREVAPLLP
jgi:DNA-binding IclR family transcriptional regulator